MTYTIGTKVTSKVNAQGLTEGATYTVEDLSYNSTFHGTYITYSLRSEENELFRIGNGHLILAAA
jgi:hypothetical protein